MTWVAGAPIVAALVIFLVGIGITAPAATGAVRLKAKRAAGSKTPMLLREQTTGRLDLALISGPEYATSARAAVRAGCGVRKRLLDVLAAIGLITALAPLIALTALAIKLDSSGPVLYRQSRIGRGGRAFRIYKFRSMIDGAEKNGAQWAEKHDCRVTRIGRVIRRTRIDEIPQAINVLRGEMSFVGPRPERPEFVELLEKEIPNYHLRHEVKPGITGWAQVKFTYGASVEDARIKLQYDLFYIKHFSLRRDLMIILMTIKVALFGVGSR